MKKSQKVIQSETASFTRQVFYWTFFIVVSLFIQFFISGIDVLVVGLLITLSEKRVIESTIVSFIFVILQEATGVLTFGLLLVEYSFIIVAFFIGRVIFAFGTFSFVLMLSLFTSIIHCVLLYGFTAVEGISVEHSILLHNLIKQSIVIPLLWYPMYHLYKRCVERGNTI